MKAKDLNIGDGVKRVTIICVLSIPDDAALFDIIQDLFVLGGPTG